MKKLLIIVFSILMIATMLAAFVRRVVDSKPSAPIARTPPPLAKKDKYKVGFSQVETNNPWRIAETESMKAEAH